MMPPQVLLPASKKHALWHDVLPDISCRHRGLSLRLCLLPNVARVCQPAAATAADVLRFWPRLQPRYGAVC
jgi:hypothetical protein